MLEKQITKKCLNENSRTIRLPVNIVQELQKQKKLVDGEINQLSTKLASLPTVINYDKTINDEGDTLIQILENKDADMPDSIFDDECNIKTELKAKLNDNFFLPFMIFNKSSWKFYMRILPISELDMFFKIRL